MRRVPRPAAGEILIRVQAAGVNRPDAQQRAGAYAPPPGASDLPGLEAAGEVAAVGPGGSPWARRRPGLRAAARRRLRRIRADAPGPRAAGAARPRRWWRRRRSARPSSPSGPTSSGAGGSRPARACWCTAAPRGSAPPRSSSRARAARGSSPPRAPRRSAGPASTLGAELAVNYREADFVAAVREATGGRGVDVILDMVGGDYLPRDVRALAPDGRLVMIAHQSGAEGRAELRPGDGQAADHHRLDPAAAVGRGQGADRRRAAPRGLAAARRPGGSRR